MALFTHSLCRHLQPGSSLRSHPEKYHRSCALRASTRLGSGRVAGFVYRSSARLAHLIKAHSICTGRGFFFFFFLLPTTFHANDKYVAYVFDWLLQACCLPPSLEAVRELSGCGCGSPTFLNKDIFALITLLVGVFLCFVHFFGGR